MREWNSNGAGGQLPAGLRVCLLAVLLLAGMPAPCARAEGMVPAMRTGIRVITARKDSYSDGRHEMRVAVPKLENAGKAGDAINREVSELTAALVNNFYCELSRTGGSGYGALYVDYAVLTNTEDWFTMRLSVSETAASSNRYFVFYNIDRARGKRVELCDLFCTGEFRGVLTAEIKRQMRAQMDQDENVVYWLRNGGSGEGFVSVRADQNFYWNADGDLVIVFDEFEVAPGSMGTPEFVMDRGLIRDLLCPRCAG